VNISRINGSRVRIWHFALQSGRGEIFRSLSTIIRSISTTTFALIDRTPLITNQVHSGRKVQLDSGDVLQLTEGGKLGLAGPASIKQRMGGAQE
jgi:hypothetical protein